MRLSEYHGDFVHSLYEACLSSETAPFEALGRELIRGLEAVAVSIWTEHPRVPGALSRMVYQQTLKNDELPQQDYYAARRVQSAEGLITDTVTLKDRRRPPTGRFLRPQSPVFPGLLGFGTVWRAGGTCSQRAGWQAVHPAGCGLVQRSLPGAASEQ